MHWYSAMPRRHAPCGQGHLVLDNEQRIESLPETLLAGHEMTMSPPAPIFLSEQKSVPLGIDHGIDWDLPASPADLSP